MPPKSRQAAQKQTGASKASGAGSQLPAKSKSVAQQQNSESNPAQWPDANAFLPPTLASLRRDWRWAAVSQFLYTFQDPLRIDPYVEAELEEDLAYGTDVALSKIVHRLLFTLAQDRKITPQNWMGYLQGQYARRYSPRPNPFSQDMLPPSHSPEPEKPTEGSDSENDKEKALEEGPDADAPGEPVDEKLDDSNAPKDDHNSDMKLDPEDVTPQLQEANPPEIANPPETSESAPATAPPEPVVKIQPMRQWSDLSQSEQLDVLWTLCEWQFTGAMRLRTLLGDDDSGVGWRMEPVGWDSKKNTYWLVGETRLWIQHHIPQPHRPPKKRARTSQAVVVPLEPTIFSRARPSFSDDEAEEGMNKLQPENGEESEPEVTSSRSLTPPPPIQSKMSSTRPSRASSTAEKRRTSESANGSRKRPKVTGTRVSLRLRGSNRKETDEEGWHLPKLMIHLGQTRHVPQPPRAPKKRARASQAVVVPLEPTIFSRAPPSFSDEDDDDEGANLQPENGDGEESEAEATSSRSLTPPPPIQSKRSSARQSRSSSTAEKRRTSESANGSRKRPKVTGTRVSLRLRGSGKKETDEDGWQSVPDEWLDKEDEPKQSPKAADPFGSDSDLTEVEELEREIEEERKKREEAEGGKRKSGRTRRKGTDKGSKVSKEPEPELEAEPVKEETLEAEDSQSKQLPVRLHVAPLVDPMLPPPLPPGFIEWETVCASLHDWEAFPARFEKATNPNEKSFRSYLNKVLVPAVTTSLKAQLKVRKLETAVQNRKRSSRLAIKESIVEAQRQDEERRAAELELHARARRQEERERRQEEDMVKRERERESKIRSRETRAGKRNGWDGSESGSASPAPTPEVSSDPPVKIRLRTGRIPSTTPTSSPVETPISSTPPSAPGSGTTSRADDSWELLCEGCGKQGWNIDDGSQLVKCESCGRWSHTFCHDRADELAGNPKRDWSLTEFTCRVCSNTARQAGVNGVTTLTKMSNGATPAVPVPSVTRLNEAQAGVPPAQIAPVPVAYMYGAFPAAPNGHATPNLPIYPPPPHMLPQQVYTPVGQPRAVLPTPTAYAPYAQPQSVPIPQFQTPVPPLSQPPPMYPSPYLNGHSGS
ncbi:unnamed protein product [Rhizoctonia solani]|uniref:Zinc finger PHD-type domain-containing protein n=1 Tax=Rhizoctonia solani TaxID=456999 RepID=A0A8H3HPZ9_9AGAM|nr:unnamed protein product [Rhizoctonia solani]